MLYLSMKELKFLWESEDFQEKLSQNIFKEYFQTVFKNTLEVFKKEKIVIEKEIVEKYEASIQSKLLEDFKYQFYDCIDEDTGDIITIII
jgi:hypothetical protein